MKERWWMRERKDSGKVEFWCTWWRTHLWWGYQTRSGMYKKGGTFSLTFIWEFGFFPFFHPHISIRDLSIGKFVCHSNRLSVRLLIHPSVKLPSILQKSQLRYRWKPAILSLLVCLLTVRQLSIRRNFNLSSFIFFLFYFVISTFLEHIIFGHLDPFAVP